MAVTKRPISQVKINTLFHEISLQYSIDPKAYSYELALLVETWKKDKFVGVYTAPTSGKPTLVKPSENDGNNKFIYQYCDLFHGRIVAGAIDPLVVVKFSPDPDSPGEEYVSLRFLADHAQLFGEKFEKSNRALMNKIRDAVDASIKQGDAKEL
ncbi:hypothetical protein K0H59_05270 [Shewanella sp. FJAT-51649]|uniref:hypothetical protein n=1 Tax=Shewanella sp. FJAT-51649 TaxID=2864210 RepID=UPI001C659930|nr:hypothetical protein [Shewanella sp. FJAT-51649]QYJ72468.1 hypothetical protein K0H59_05270 [Shewanella sp. FJAT-51649]